MQHKKDESTVCSRYTSLQKLLAGEIDKKDFVCIFRRRTWQDLCIPCIVCMHNLDEGETLKLWTPRSGFRNILTRKRYESQAGPHDIAAVADSSPGKFFILSGPAFGKLYV